MDAKIGLWAHFARLADFRGREDRGSFWPYAALVFGIVMVIGAVIFVPLMAHTMQAMQQYAVEHPDQVTVSSGPVEHSMSVHANPPGTVPDRTWISVYLGVSFGLSIILYAAAVARRLHDRGLSGWWGAMPLPFVFYSSIEMPRMFAFTGNQPDMALFFSIFFSNMLYIITLIILIVLLAGVGKPVPDKFDTA